MTSRTSIRAVALLTLAVLLGGLLARGDASAQTAPAGTFAAAPVFSDSGLAAVVFTGGSTAQLEAAATQAGATGVWAQDSAGRYQLLVVSGPAFVGAAFAGAFPSGFGLTAVTLTGRTITQLKYAVFDRFGHIWYCDPDFYPIARQDEEVLARDRFPQIQADVEVFNAIVGHLGYASTSTYTPAQTLAIYREWKMLRALAFDRSGTGYHFNARFTRDDQTGTLVDGTVDRGARITVTSQAPTGQPPCPICLVAGVRIDTPSGPTPVEALREGMAIWTLGEHGERVLATVLRAGSMAAAPDHEVVHLVLDDGREVTASPGHPLADGRAFGAILPGDTVDGARVLSTERVPYSTGATYDVLPSGPTGTYWANGVPVASTITR